MNHSAHRHTHWHTLTLWALIGCNNLMDRQISRCVNSVSHRVSFSTLHTLASHNHFHMCVYVYYEDSVCVCRCVRVCVLSSCKQACRINKQADCQRRFGGEEDREGGWITFTSSVPRRPQRRARFIIALWLIIPPSPQPSWRVFL